MAAIYRNAYIVIAADVSKDCDTRFLPRMLRLQREKALVEFTEPDGSSFVIFGHSDDNRGHPQLLKARGLFKGLRPLGERAWALQEEVLASRIVHFTSHELFWQCQSSIFCECRELDGELSNAVVNPRLHFRDCIESKEPTLTMWNWETLVNDYMSRAIPAARIDFQRCPAW